MVMNFWLEISVSLVIVTLVLNLCYRVIPNSEEVRGFFIRNQKFLSPNCISNWRKYGGILLIISFIIAVKTQTIWAVYSIIWLFVLLAITDLLDGIVARFCNLETKEGAILDAEADKWFDLPVLFAFCFFPAFEPVYLIIVTPLAIFDFWGQKIRGKNSPPEASIVGKTKTTIKFIVIYLMSLNGRYPEIYDILKLETIILVLLIFALVFAGLSMSMKTKWYRESVRVYLDDFQI